jgi:hypothetical protein
LFLDGIHKKISSGFNLKHSRILYGIFLTVSFQPIFDMGDNLEECKGDLFSIGKIVDIEITF